MSAADKLSKKLRPIAESSLHRGEELQGVVASSSAKVYGSKTFVIVVTDKRLVIQRTGPTWEPTGAPIPIHPDEIAEYEFRGMAPRLFRGPLAGLSRAGFRMNIRTFDDTPFELTGMTGSGIFGRLGGGKPQAAGVEALREWLDALDFGDR